MKATAQAEPLTNPFGQRGGSSPENHRDIIRLLQMQLILRLVSVAESVGLIEY
jgi:hypothetical protein